MAQPVSQRQGGLLHFCVFEVKALFLPRLDSCTLPLLCEDRLQGGGLVLLPTHSGVQGSSSGCPVKVQSEHGTSIAASLSSHLGDL